MDELEENMHVCNLLGFYHVFENSNNSSEFVESFKHTKKFDGWYNE